MTSQAAARSLQRYRKARSLAAASASYTITRDVTGEIAPLAEVGAEGGPPGKPGALLCTAAVGLLGATSHQLETSR